MNMLEQVIKLSRLHCICLQTKRMCKKYQFYTNNWSNRSGIQTRLV